MVQLKTANDCAQEGNDVADVAAAIERATLRCYTAVVDQDS